MEKVIVSALTISGEEFLSFSFNDSIHLSRATRKVVNARWNEEHGFWYLPLSRENYRCIQKAFAGIAELDISLLRDFLNKRAASSTPVSPVLIENPGATSLPAAIPRQDRGKDRSAGINEINWHVLWETERYLKLKSYSKSTIKTYLNEVVQFLRALKNRAADNVTEDQIRSYLLFCHEKLKLSENTLHSRINALKFYYEQVLKRDRFFWDVPRPKKPVQLPRLLNEDELARLFNALSNKKHKAMLFTAYSAGLRVSEIVSLRLEDIDSSRMQIFVRNAKGKKDRYVNLSPVLLDILRDYAKNYTPRPKEFLFESGQTGTAYPTRTVQQIFWNAKVKAGIRKKIGIHSLRHSFATHLLDKGTDIKYIKDLLGHFNIKTTERYLHVSKKQLVNIVSPFDDLFKGRDIQW